jgi:hypothetical protein
MSTERLLSRGQNPRNEVSAEPGLAQVQVVDETFGSGGVAGSFEPVDQGLQSPLGVALVARLIERLPVGLSDALAVPLGQLREQVADAVDGAVLAIRGGPALLDRLDQPGGAVGDDQQRRAEPAGDQVGPSSSQSSCDSRIPSITDKSTGAVRCSV